MSRISEEARRIWTAPTIVAAATLVGLIGALIAEGLWDVLASLVLFVVLAYPTALGLRSAKDRNRQRRRQ
jgi:cation transport ATPase